MSIRRGVALLACVLACIEASAAAADDDVQRHEAWIGIGDAYSFEEDVFNVPRDFSSDPDEFGGLGYMYNFNPRLAVGAHLLGASEMSPFGELVVDSTGNGPMVRFDLETLEFGVRARYTFKRTRFVPYVLAGINYAFGSISSDLVGELTYHGTTGLVGVGMGMMLGRHFMISAEGVGLFGNASWKIPPFDTSSGDRFNPSLVGATLNVSYLWTSWFAQRPKA